MSDPLSKFLSEHRASEFGLAPVSKAYAIKLAENLESERDALLATRDALIDISEQEEETCGYCNGSGGRYADGNTHYPSENAPVVPCGQCGGYGKVPPTDAREIALDALAALPERLK